MPGDIPPLTPYVFMEWCFVKHRDDFTVTLLLRVHCEHVTERVFLSWWLRRWLVCMNVARSTAVFSGKTVLPSRPSVTATRAQGRKLGSSWSHQLSLLQNLPLIGWRPWRDPANHRARFSLLKVTLLSLFRSWKTLILKPASQVHRNLTVHPDNFDVPRTMKCSPKGLDGRGSNSARVVPHYFVQIGSRAYRWLCSRG